MKRIRGICIIILLGATLLSFVNAQEIVTSCETREEITADILEYIYSDANMNNAYAIKNYCNIVQGLFKDEKVVNQCAPLADGVSTYNVQDSLFVKFLCTNMSPRTKNNFNKKFNESDGYLKTLSFSDLGILQYNQHNKNVCDVSKYVTLNECDIPIHIPKIFTNIMNDYFDIKQASMYGIKNFDEKVEKIVSNFSEKYLAAGKKKDGFNLCSDDSYYPHTCKLMKDYVKQAHGLLRKTRVINTDDLKNDKADCENTSVERYDYLYCALRSKANLDNQQFVNLVYNELYWYEMFISYYQHVLVKNPNLFLSYKQQGLSSTKVRDLQNEKVKQLSLSSDRLSSAIDISFSRLWEIKNTFPYHIGLSMYQEDLYNLRKQLAKMYSPLMTLYDKLRNVQDAKS